MACAIPAINLTGDWLKLAQIGWGALQQQRLAVSGEHSVDPGTIPRMTAPGWEKQHYVVEAHDLARAGTGGYGGLRTAMGRNARGSRSLSSRVPLRLEGGASSRPISWKGFGVVASRRLYSQNQTWEVARACLLLCSAPRWRPPSFQAFFSPSHAASLPVVPRY